MGLRPRSEIRLLAFVLVSIVVGAISVVGMAVADYDCTSREVAVGGEGIAVLALGETRCDGSWGTTHLEQERDYVVFRAGSAEVYVATVRESYSAAHFGIPYSSQGRGTEVNTGGPGTMIGLYVWTQEDTWQYPEGPRCLWGAGVMLSRDLPFDNRGGEGTAWLLTLPLGCEGPHRLDRVLLP